MRRPDTGSAEPSGDPDIFESEEPARSREQPPSLSVGPRSPRLPRWVKLVVAGVAAVVLAFGVRAYRQRQERRIVALSTARAEQLFRADTWLGYHEAAILLGLRAAEVDPAGAGSLRALALAMLALDYRDDQAATAARALVDAADVAGDPTPRVHLAAAALALREGRGATAVERLALGGDGSLRHVLTARVALAAGNPPGANEPMTRALAADPRLPAALALRGDLLRRAGRTTEARDAYAGALKESTDALAAGLGPSPTAANAAPHARASFGLAKLALSRDVPAAEATAALAPIVEHAAGTPDVERARASMYLSALQGRLGDRAAAAATLAGAPVEPGARAWLESAAARLETSRERYRVPDATPPALLSASDDDPYVPPPPPPPPPQPAIPRLHGFKVHGPPRPAVKAGGKAVSRTKAKPPAKSAPTKKKPAGKKRAPPGRAKDKEQRKVAGKIPDHG